MIKGYEELLEKQKKVIDGFHKDVNEDGADRHALIERAVNNLRKLGMTSGEALKALRKKRGR